MIPIASRSPGRQPALTAATIALFSAQTRVESGVHSALEVAYGGVLGALITLVVFQVLA